MDRTLFVEASRFQNICSSDVATFRCLELLAEKICSPDQDTVRPAETFDDLLMLA